MSQATSRRSPFAEVSLLFLKLGAFSFGGPAAYIAIMQREIVRERKWIGDQDFLDLLGATNLIPGPNATEMAIHLGLRRAGWRGFFSAGVLFIVPGAFATVALAWAYVRYGSLPQVGWVLYGVKPVIIAIILQALWDLGRKAVKGPVTAVTGTAVLALYLIGFNEIAVLFAGAAAVVLVYAGRKLWKRAAPAAMLLPLIKLPAAVAGAAAAAAAAAAAFSMAGLFFSFLKIGSVLYGSGYVLVAFMRSEFVDRLGWITNQQLLDAIAVGQATPGPVFSSATFVGYLVGSWQGALVATVGIFLPSFIFVALLSRILKWAKSSPWARAFLDGVNVASLGLMAGVTWQLGRAGVVDLFTIALAAISLVLVLRFKVNSVWLILGGAAQGCHTGSLSAEHDARGNRPPAIAIPCRGIFAADLLRGLMQTTAMGTSHSG
jgi:chromate transporter